ncbi:MAG: glucose-6-phosphate isomerase [Gemmatimonadetes bacterium]|nr:glucose-6-phosphate isomerase [Gemmatimonadota bacterium]MYA40410.1 glucose-6-phosphate isomerase [Gemmatimonadota bacterium]MYE95208.1 glucose-6-phosphate isomerase [Gemmatimonadota bacterium]MYJ09041.1 glucose-6-phosphate isomerase [Gemmatimonadota bacterium]
MDRIPPASMSSPTIDFANAVAGVVPGTGIDPDRLHGDLAARFRDAHAAVTARRRAGEMGFFALPADRDLTVRTGAVAATVAPRFESLVVIGIGGSALGTAALRDALLPPAWNELDAASRGGRPRLHLMDNPDPDSVAALLGRLNPARTCFNVVSKSGSTAETMAHLLVAWTWVESSLGPGGPRERFVVTTSPGRGPLRKLAEDHGLLALDVPDAVGGRFSVLSPAALFPAAVTGIDTGAVLAGAAEAAARCSTPELLRNSAGVLATLLHVADTEMGCPVHVFMPYADRLRGLAYWIQQLWAESLGKAVDREGRPVESGPTPLPSFGAADQHSVLQLLMEGPRDKIVVFLGREVPERDVGIPERFAEEPALACLGGHTLFDLLDAERRATAEAMRREGRPNLTVMTERLDAHAVGSLLMLFQIAVVYAGELYGVNPLDQPGVELGKKLTFGLMGRDGYPRPEAPRSDSRWRV